MKRRNEGSEHRQLFSSSFVIKESRKMEQCLEMDVGPRFLFCLAFKNDEMTTCFYAHRNDPVERRKVDDER